MTEQTNFRNSPITEAIFDIRVSLPNETTLEDLEEFQKEVKIDFPKKEPRISLTGSLNLEAITEAIPLSSSRDGWILVSGDSKRITQIRLDGFTFSRLKPYENWNKFYSEAYELWQNYAKIACPQEINRVALRYINRIEIPFSGPLNLKDYIRTTPEVSSDLPVTIVDQFMRLVIVHEKYLPSQAIVTQTIDKNSDHNILPIILDIDVFQEVSVSPEDNDKIKSFFEENLRSFRNEIFFRSITDKAKELFQ